MGEAKEMEVKRGRKGAGEWGADPGERVGPAWASCADGADSELNFNTSPRSLQGTAGHHFSSGNSLLRALKVSVSSFRPSFWV